jgi:hypothetical protein
MKNLKRRQFNRFVMVSTAVAALGIPAERAVAQARPVLLGIRMRPMAAIDQSNTGADETDGADGTDAEIVIQTINPETGQIQDRAQPQLQGGGGIPSVLRRDERLGGFAALAKGSLFVTKTQGIPGEPEVLSRLMISNGSSQTLTITGLGANNTVESLLITNDGSILCIVSLNSGVPPFRLATIDAQTGKASLVEGFNFPPNQRFSNLTQCPNGTIFGTSLGTEGSVRLVQLDLQKRQIIDLPLLRFEKRPVSNDLKSLTCSGADQLYALADPLKRDSNLLLTVDIGTGAMNLVKEIDAEKITFSRP